jgi:predicted ArsR family transcriptional regulator
MLHVVGGRRQDILRLLLEQKDGMSIDEIAEALPLTRSAARDHIRSLERDDLVSGALSPVPTGGRPGVNYTLTPQGHALFPKNYDGIARLLLATLVTRLGQAEAEKELKALGRQLAAQVKPRVGSGSLKDKAVKIAAIMEELGFSASASGDTIEAQNCIYHEMAQADPTICTIDLALIGELSEAKVDHKACMARGDASCRFCLKK